MSVWWKMVRMANFQWQKEVCVCLGGPDCVTSKFDHQNLCRNTIFDQKARSTAQKQGVTVSMKIDSQ